MKILKNDLLVSLSEGIKNAWYSMYQMTGELNEPIKPEYLMTMSVCFSLADYIDENNLRDTLVVRSECQTKKIWRKLGMPHWLGGVNKSTLKKNSTRNGNVDLSLFYKNNGFEKPVTVIENKGYLKFSECGDLYQSSKSEVDKDLARNIEFLSDVVPACGGVEYTAFTFLLNDTQSALNAEGVIYCGDKKAYFEQYVDKLIQGLGFEREVIVGTVDKQLYNTAEELDERDEDGTPASISGETWHIVYGVIVIHNIKNLQDTQIQLD